MFYRSFAVLSFFSLIASCGGDGDDTAIVGPESIQPPQFTNLVTGSSVRLTLAHWDGLRDFEGTVACRVSTFDGNSYVELPAKILTYSYGPQSWAKPEGTVSINDNNTRTEETWTVDSGVYSGPTNLGQSLWYETVEIEDGFNLAQGIRSWITDNMYEDCWQLSGDSAFEATGTPNQESVFDTVPCIDDQLNNGSSMDNTVSCPTNEDTQGATYAITFDGASIQTAPHPVNIDDFEDKSWSCTDVSAQGEYAPSQATKSWQFNSNGTGTTDQVGRGSLYDARFIWIWTEHGVQVAEFSKDELQGELFEVNNHPDSSYWITSSPEGNIEFRSVSLSGAYSGGKACSIDSAS